MSDNQYERYLEILLPSDLPFSSYSCEPDRCFGPLSLVNIFIGANNSGKSRLLRALFGLKEFGYTTSNNYRADAIYSLIQEANTEFKRIFSRNSISSIDNVSSSHFEEVLGLGPHFVIPTAPIDKVTEAKIKALLQVSGSSISFESNMRAIDTHAVVSALHELGTKLSERFNQQKKEPSVKFKKRYYIPILRGMRPFGGGGNNEYHNRTVNDYFVGPDRHVIIPNESTIFTGLELYQTLKDKLLGEPEDREDVRKFEKFLSEKFFRSQTITLIPREGDTTVHVKIGEEKQLPIYQLGDGLQSLLICTFNIFMARDRSLFFIEEPDICMHPFLQRAFLEVISFFDQHQYFITTHSNHFLDMTLDFSNISVLHFAKIEKGPMSFQVQVASSRDHNLLRDLGVRNSSVFLTNATIWVEGITDRLYIRTYMEKYCQELKQSDPTLAAALSNFREDSHYSFMEYQGANLIHWSFNLDGEDARRMKAAYVCARALLIADGDIVVKGDRVETFRAMLGERFFILPAKEIENFIPQEVLWRLVADEFRKHGKDVGLINYSEYSKAEEGLGRYLDGLLGDKVFATESGTVKSKVSFCEKATEIMRDSTVEWSLPTELKSLCELIFKHIRNENPE